MTTKNNYVLMRESDVDESIRFCRVLRKAISQIKPMLDCEISRLEALKGKADNEDNIIRKWSQQNERETTL